MTTCWRTTCWRVCGLRGQTIVGACMRLILQRFSAVSWTRAAQARSPSAITDCATLVHAARGMAGQAGALEPDCSSALPGCSCPNGQICELKLDDLGGCASALVSTVLPPCAKLTASRAMPMVRNSAVMSVRTNSANSTDKPVRSNLRTPRPSTTPPRQTRCRSTPQCACLRAGVHACYRGVCLPVGMLACGFACMRASVRAGVFAICMQAGWRAVLLFGFASWLPL